jgi:hypothetical protein
MIDRNFQEENQKASTQIRSFPLARKRRRVESRRPKSARTLSLLSSLLFSLLFSPLFSSLFSSLLSFDKLGVKSVYRLPLTALPQYRWTTLPLCHVLPTFLCHTLTYHVLPLVWKDWLGCC